MQDYLLVYLVILQGGEEHSPGHYRWQNPLTGKVENVHYNEGAKGKSLLKKK